MVDEHEEQIRSVHRGQSLGVAATLSVVLLMAGMLGLGVAIQQRIIALPELDVQFRGSHVVVYMTQAPDCIRYLTSCPPELIARPTQDFYVIWVLTQTGQPAPPDERKTATRLLTLVLREP